MADIIVYLVSKVTAKMRESALSWVDDAGLSRLMGEGYEQVSMMDRKVEGTKATMIVLRPSGENRGLARAEPQDRMDVPDGYGGTKSLAVVEALAHTQRELSLALQGMGDSGHLGAARNHSMPGMTIVSGELVGKAYDAGQIAANQGKSTSACPFPPGTAPYTKWMQGYRSAGSQSGDVSANAQKEAFDIGRHVAMSLGRDDSAHCPYPQGSPLRAHWLDGFKSGGGRVL